MIRWAQEDAFAGGARAALLLSDTRWGRGCMAPHQLVGAGDRAMGRCPGHNLRPRQSSAAVSARRQTTPPATAHDVGQRGALAARERETTMTTITLKALLEVLPSGQRPRFQRIQLKADCLADVCGNNKAEAPGNSR